MTDTTDARQVPPRLPLTSEPAGACPEHHDGLFWGNSGVQGRGGGTLGHRGLAEGQSAYPDRVAQLPPPLRCSALVYKHPNVTRPTTKNGFVLKIPAAQLGPSWGLRGVPRTFQPCLALSVLIALLRSVFFCLIKLVAGSKKHLFHNPPLASSPT